MNQRIDLARYIMIAGIIVLHAPPTVSLGEVQGFFETVRAFFTHGLFRFSVPVLSTISGYLLFKTIERKTYSSILKTKVRTLVLPMLIWNLPLVIALYLLQANTSSSHEFSFQAYPFDGLQWLSGVFGIFQLPVNYPLNFLRDIFAITLFTPLIYITLKHFNFIGLVLLCLFFWFNLEGSFVLRNLMAINFCCGAWVALKGVDVFQLDRFRLWSVGIIIIACFSIVFFEIENKSYFRLLAPFFLWSALSYLDGSKLAEFILRYSKQSFFVFCAHGPLLVVMWIIYKLVNSFVLIPYPIFWIVTPVVILVLCNVLYTLGYRFIPSVMKWSLGGR